MHASPPRSPLIERASLAATAVLEAVGVRRVPPSTDGTEEFVRLCSSLRRLDREITRLRRSDRRTPALYHRLSSASLAYDMVLRDTGRAIGLPVPAGRWLDAATRLELEAALAAAGVDW